MIDVARVEKIKHLVLKKYDSFSDEVVEEIRSFGSDIPIEVFFEFIEEFQYDMEVTTEEEELLENNLLPICAYLYSFKDIVDMLKKGDDYSSIPMIMEYFQKLGLSIEPKIDYNDLIDEVISNGKCKSAVYLYEKIIDDLSFESKTKVFYTIKENIEGVYLHQEKMLADLLKTGCALNEDISFLSEIIKEYPKTLVELCLNKELEVLKKYLIIASDDEKNIIKGLITLNSAKVITDELMEELFFNLNQYEMGSALASFALKKGYIPGLDTYHNNRSYFSKDLEILSEKNLIYYYLESSHSSITYGIDHKIDENRKLQSEEIKQAIKLIRELSKERSFWYEIKPIDHVLEKIFKVEEIPNYFNKTGCKKELLYEIFSACDKDLSDFYLPYLVYEKCKEELTEIEKKYYDLFTSIYRLRPAFYYGTSKTNELMEIIPSIESVETLKEEQIINVLNSTKDDQRILISLLKTGFITNTIKQAICTPQEATALEIIKEYLDNGLNLPDIFNLLKDIYGNEMFFDENGALKNEYFEYCIANNFTKYITTLSNKFITNEQRVFISIMEKTIGNEYASNPSDKIDFIRETFLNKEELSKYIQNGKATKELANKMFEIGALENIEVLDNYQELLTDKQKIIFEVLKKIQEKEIKEAYCDFIKGSLTSIYDEKISEEIITKLPDLLNKINLSNSSEVAGRYISIAKLILQNTTVSQIDPMKQFAKIEKIFLTRELSHMDKIFKSFQLLYPHDKLIEAIKNREDRVSPTLLKYAEALEDTILGKEAEKLYGDKTYAVEMIMYSDLLKTTIASNDKTFIEYIDNIEKGNNLFKSLVSNEKTIKTLLPEERYILTYYVSHLANLYNKTNPDKKIKISKDLDQALTLLISVYEGVNIDLIPDQIIKNKYQAYLGISTMEELRLIMKQAKIDADKKGREYAKRPLILENGDLIKGIGQIIYLDTIIQNGSVSKEFLGGDVESDYTPFDTDLSYILEPKATVNETLRSLDADSFGPIYFVIKGSKDKFNYTRTNALEKFVLNETSEEFRKIELFRTCNDRHYGIRTGFSSTQVDYIYCKNGSPTIEQISLIIAKNGFYIPVIDQNMNLAFTPEDYDFLRSKMSGLSYYGIDSYNFSSTISNIYTDPLVDDIIENIKETKKQKQELEMKLGEGFEKAGLEMKLSIDGDMRTGSVELIDTGSTSRGTNQIGDGDFDFMVRLDRIYKKKDSKDIKHSVCKALGIGETSSDIRKAKVQLSDKEVEIDISYASKSDKITYTTDMCISDRLETIKKQDPEKYFQVLANIVLAKNILKTAECYKPHHASENPQGGLGGVGTENWILQNGGSLEDAATEFLIASGVLKTEVDEEGKSIIVVDENSKKDHRTFSTSYRIWDFGQNQMTEMRTRDFPYDNFVWNNMNEKGYSKMVKAMQTYILELHPEFKFIPSQNTTEELINVEDKVRTYLQSAGRQNSNTENKGK